MSERPTPEDVTTARERLHRAEAALIATEKARDHAQAQAFLARLAYEQVAARAVPLRVLLLDLVERDYPRGARPTTGTLAAATWRDPKVVAEVVAELAAEGQVRLVRGRWWPPRASRPPRGTRG